MSIKSMREYSSLRSAAYECKMRAIEMLKEDIHVSATKKEFERCTIDNIVTQKCTFDLCNTNEYGEVKDVYVSGINSPQIPFRLKTRVLFLNYSPFELKEILTEKF